MIKPPRHVRKVSRNWKLAFRRIQTMIFKKYPRDLIIKVEVNAVFSLQFVVLSTFLCYMLSM